ncbi:heterokaryon incompatibility protein-domain-containing protein [Alternaria rosae]|uniref:heterokaryon incompatibility protein-domain-containing protein n=1 Tax=Alternaria rosae TaxID=1187941 RepID=UPI001E8DE9BD|nr:heterokaryon incompatibility protein-domain-containing protein [Alternaria rosae]KAH6873337.1 heterokaryon incompatibility protein-domain-containing protein [Alternaria rosae]
MSTVYKGTPLHIDDSTNIRLLKILPTDDETTPITCTIRVVALEGSPKYTALSYEWGPPQPTKKILLNGEPFIIRENLWNFLNQARRYRKSWEFWIDAICIDQISDAERTHQVSMMGKIYSIAELAVAWLGTAILDTPEWLSLLEEIPDIHLYRACSDSVDWCRRYRDCISYLCSLSYWSRIWIVQEYVLSQKVIIWIGRHHTTGENMERLRAMCKMVPGQYSALIGVETPAMQILQHRRNRTDVRARGRSYSLILENVVLEFAGSKCVDPRDHVYALLSLCDPLEVTEASITPDYSKSTLEIYIQLLRRAEKSLVESGRSIYEDEVSETKTYMGKLRSLLGVELEEFQNMDPEITKLLTKNSYIFSNYPD